MTDQPEDNQPLPAALREVLRAVSDPHRRKALLENEDDHMPHSHVDLAIVAARAAAVMHPVPPAEDWPKDPRVAEVAQLHAIGGLLADALACLQHAYAQLQRDVLELQNRTHPAAIYRRDLPDGRVITVYEHNKRQYGLGVGPQNSGVIDSNFYYVDGNDAVRAGIDWSGRGDPADGWFRHPQSGRRREDGDPSKETVRA